MANINERLKLLHKHEARLGRTDFKIMFALAMSASGISNEALALQVGSKYPHVICFLCSRLKSCGFANEVGGKWVFADTWDIERLRQLYAEESTRGKNA
jgi:hypothetical protein